MVIDPVLITGIVTAAVVGVASIFTKPFQTAALLYNERVTR